MKGTPPVKLVNKPAPLASKYEQLLYTVYAVFVSSYANGCSQPVMDCVITAAETVKLGCLLKSSCFLKSWKYFVVSHCQLAGHVRLP